MVSQQHLRQWVLRALLKLRGRFALKLTCRPKFRAWWGAYGKLVLNSGCHHSGYEVSTPSKQSMRVEEPHCSPTQARETLGADGHPTALQLSLFVLPRHLIFTQFYDDPQSCQNKFHG